MDEAMRCGTHCEQRARGSCMWHCPRTGTPACPCQHARMRWGCAPCASKRPVRRYCPHACEWSGGRTAATVPASACCRKRVTYSGDAEVLRRFGARPGPAEQVFVLMHAEEDSCRYNQLENLAAEGLLGRGAHRLRLPLCSGSGCSSGLMRWCCSLHGCGHSA